MYNGIDISQTGDYIKISCKLFVEKSCKKYLETWMNNYMISATRPAPLPSDLNWLKKFNNATRDPDKKIQANLLKI
jgi:hypothetical protein